MSAGHARARRRHERKQQRRRQEMKRPSRRREEEEEEEGGQHGSSGWHGASAPSLSWPVPVGSAVAAAAGGGATVPRRRIQPQRRGRRCSSRIFFCRIPCWSTSTRTLTGHSLHVWGLRSLVASLVDHGDEEEALVWVLVGWLDLVLVISKEDDVRRDDVCARPSESPFPSSEKILTKVPT